MRHTSPCKPQGFERQWGFLPPATLPAPVPVQWLLAGHLCVPAGAWFAPPALPAAAGACRQHSTAGGHLSPRPQACCQACGNCSHNDRCLGRHERWSTAQALRLNDQHAVRVVCVSTIAHPPEPFCPGLLLTQSLLPPQLLSLCPCPLLLQTLLPATLLSLCPCLLLLESLMPLALLCLCLSSLLPHNLLPLVLFGCCLCPGLRCLLLSSLLPTALLCLVQTSAGHGLKGL